ncbi:MAG: LamG domain-containing protein [Bryobacterales bacterium]
MIFKIFRSGIRAALFVTILALHMDSFAAPPDPPASETWTFDRLDQIGGHKTTVLGDPKVIDTPVGKAVEFDGVNDALFIDLHPLAGAKTFTWEAVFRPDGGEVEQRWFHLNESPATGVDTENRMLFEIRVINGQWCLDAFVQTGTASKALLDRKKLQPLGEWYHVAAVYDGREFRSYINGVQDGAAELHLEPQGPGRASVGVRINKVFYFKGAVAQARFTRRALSPGEFLKLPRR